MSNHNQDLAPADLNGAIVSRACHAWLMKNDSRYAAKHAADSERMSKSHAERKAQKQLNQEENEDDTDT